MPNEVMMDNDAQPKPGSLLDFERPRLDDPLYIDNKEPHGFMTDPNDGMPKPAVNTTITDSEAADLLPERFVCMGTPGLKLPILGQITGRKPCVHYRRQLLPSQDKQHQVCVRLCAKVLNDEGEMTSLNDSEVLACELREPRDPKSEQQLDDFDRVIMERQKQRREDEKEFDVDAALGD